ncbi:MerR family DNA-binding transcriptional regulator, partial [Acidimicrobiaceae bacterium USS-CC1]|nr:MerR family DNA-binding transcriptional regulator [Acidiferrimicrobium australe]
MAERTHLTIGEVLTLLREEFPDVSISKIRFLESQGLVDPERTPSGYRKFYDHDVERLRWILQQQREHFLPLKVIRGRLNEQRQQGGDGRDEPPGTAGATATAEHNGNGPGAHAGGPGDAGGTAAA